MPFETEDIIELNEARLRQLYKDLENITAADPNYKKTVENIEILSKVLESYNQTEMKRLDNNAKNDIEEAKLILDQQKLQNERVRNRGEWWSRFLYAGLVAGSAYFSYNMDKIKIPSKAITWAKENFLRKGFMK